MRSRSRRAPSRVPAFDATTAHPIAPAPASHTNGDGTHAMIAHASAAPLIRTVAIRQMVRRVTSIKPRCCAGTHRRRRYNSSLTPTNLLTNFHETYREHDAAKASSSRTFGFVMGALFLLLAFRSRASGGLTWSILLDIAIVFVLVAAALPGLLTPLNRLWMALGKLLNRIVSPVILALLFFGIIWPVAFFMRRAGNDPLRLKRAAAGESYWVAREPLRQRSFHAPVLIAQIMSIIRELWQFLRARKKYWLVPVVVALLLIGGLLVFAQGSVLAPFIYTLF